MLILAGVLVGMWCDWFKISRVVVDYSSPCCVAPISTTPSCCMFVGGSGRPGGLLQEVVPYDSSTPQECGKSLVCSWEDPQLGKIA